MEFQSEKGSFKVASQMIKSCASTENGAYTYGDTRALEMSIFRQISEPLRKMSDFCKQLIG